MTKKKFPVSVGLLLVHAGGMFLLLLFVLLFYVFLIRETMQKYDNMAQEKTELSKNLEALPELSGGLVQARQMLLEHERLMGIVVPKTLSNGFAFSEFKDRLTSEALRLELNLELLDPGEVSERPVAGCMELPVSIRAKASFAACREFLAMILRQSQNAPRVQMLRLQPEDKSELCHLELQIVLRAASEKEEDTHGS